MWAIALFACGEGPATTGLEASIDDSAEPRLLADIAVSPWAMAYGDGSTERRERTVLVANDGPGDLVVDAVAVDPPDVGFAVDPDRLPWRLAPGEIARVEVAYEPVGAAFARATLSVASDDPDEPVVAVELDNDVTPECSDAFGDALPWRASPWWASTDPNSHPIDHEGLSWYDPDFDDAAWWPVALPDVDDAAAYDDRFYRTHFWVDEPGPPVGVSLVGNDGVWLYVNGAEVGHWGADWRGAGCVNQPGCSVDDEVDPIDVTRWLVPGDNVVAVMLSNGPAGASLDVAMTCAP